MDYSFNYKFLSEFREKNHLSKRDLLEALGSSDYTGINRWLDGKTPIHVTAMLRLCNYYNIPMDGFFFDGDGESTLIIRKPDADSQTTPTDGYGINNVAGKSIIETHITERHITSQQQAAMVAEGLKRRETFYVQSVAVTQQPTEQPEAPEAEGDNSQLSTLNSQLPESEAILRIRLEHANELRSIERECHEREDRIRRDCQATFDAERNRLMDIIERQNAELAKLYGRKYEPTEFQPLVANDEPDAR